MEESLRTIQMIAQISAFGPVAASVIGIIIAVFTTESSQSISRLPYFGRIVAVLVGGVILNFAISNAFGPSEEAIQQFLADEIISSLWITTISSILIALIAGFLVGHFTVGRCGDMGKSNRLALLVIFTPAIIYFSLAPSRRTS